jgi:hypothetical protein
MKVWNGWTVQNSKTEDVLVFVWVKWIQQSGAASDEVIKEQAKVIGQQMSVTFCRQKLCILLQKWDCSKGEYCINCVTNVQIHSPEFCRAFYPYDPTYIISHAIWYFNTSIKNIPRHTKIQFTGTLALMPILVEHRLWCYNGVWL